MPLHIREMILRTTLTGNDTDSGKKEQARMESAPEINTEHIIAECMEKLMQWLREENER